MCSLSLLVQSSSLVPILFCFSFIPPHGLAQSAFRMCLASLPHIYNKTFSSAIPRSDHALIFINLKPKPSTGTYEPHQSTSPLQTKVLIWLFWGMHGLFVSTVFCLSPIWLKILKITSSAACLPCSNHLSLLSPSAFLCPLLSLAFHISSWVYELFFASSLSGIVALSLLKPSCLPRPGHVTTVPQSSYTSLYELPFCRFSMPLGYDIGMLPRVEIIFAIHIHHDYTIVCLSAPAQSLLETAFGWSLFCNPFCSLRGPRKFY